MDHIRFSEHGLDLLDQRVLPREVAWVRCTGADEVAAAIRDMVVRGAPAIGVAAAYGIAMEVSRGGDPAHGRATLLASRPTAINLRWAVDRILGVPAAEMVAAARALHEEDIRVNQALSAHGAALLPTGATVYTHCNAGALATAGWGTALGIIRTAHAQGKIRMVYAGETRPYLQGARLTAWELDQDGIPVTLVADVAAASLLASGHVDAVIVGTDRVAANGDTANKIGTLGLAVLARHYGVPFYVALPLSTLDPACPNGAAIPIEERDPDEVRGFRSTIWAADVPVHNPAFDVTPAALVTAWITERGLWRPGALLD